MFEAKRGCAEPCPIKVSVATRLGVMVRMMGVVYSPTHSTAAVTATATSFSCNPRSLTTAAPATLPPMKARW